MEPAKAKITTTFIAQHFERKGEYLLIHLDDAATIMFDLCGLRPDMNKPVKLTAEIELAQPQGSSE